MTVTKMQLQILAAYALSKQASDIHLTLRKDLLQIDLRIPEGLLRLDQDLFGAELFEYLRFISGMDLCRPLEPQSKEFSISLADSRLDCRFSALHTEQGASGVIRLLPQTRRFELEDLCSSRKACEALQKLCLPEHGLIIACGPTGSGKSTAIHALLKKIAQGRKRKIVTLEDPVEIREPSMLQLEIDEKTGFDLENGLAALLRHDPDILYVGECRSANSAKMTVRAALTGHLVFTTLHCGDGAECLYRLEDLGVETDQLQTLLRGIFICRLITRPDGCKEGIYEIWNEEDLQKLFWDRKNAKPGLSFEGCLSSLESLQSDS